MGRTNATYRNHLDDFMDRFSSFRRALRKENKTHLDSLWEKAHSFASAGSYMNSTSPGIVATVSIMLGLQKQLDELEKRVERIEQRMES